MVWPVHTVRSSLIVSRDLTYPVGGVDLHSTVIPRRFRQLRCLPRAEGDAEPAFGPPQSASDSGADDEHQCRRAEVEGHEEEHCWWQVARGFRDPFRARTDVQLSVRLPVEACQAVVHVMRA